MEHFKVGDRVLWTRALSEPIKERIIGTIVAVIPSRVPSFTMYDVEFEFGTFALYGTQIEGISKDEDEQTTKAVSRGR